MPINTTLVVISILITYRLTNPTATFIRSTYIFVINRFIYENRLVKNVKGAQSGRRWCVDSQDLFYILFNSRVCKRQARTDSPVVVLKLYNK